MNIRNRGSRALCLGLLAVAGLALAPAAFARSHVSIGINLPGVSLGYWGGHHGRGYVNVGGYYGGGYYGGGYYGAGYYGGYAPSYYDTYYYRSAPVYYSRPVYYGPTYYRSRNYYRGSDNHRSYRDRDYYARDRGYRNRDRGYQQRGYDRGGSYDPRYR